MTVVNRSVVPIRSREDIVRVRQAVRESAVAQGFSLVDQTKLVTAAQAVLRPPARGTDQVAQPNRARLRPGLLHDDHGIAFDTARAG